jgi:hypothetical protein
MHWATTVRNVTCCTKCAQFHRALQGRDWPRRNEPLSTSVFTSTRDGGSSYIVYID